MLRLPMSHWIVLAGLPAALVVLCTTVAGQDTGRGGPSPATEGQLKSRPTTVNAAHPAGETARKPTSRSRSPSARRSSSVPTIARSGRPTTADVEPGPQAPRTDPSPGFYSQENPEVADWETKWAVEHGVSFFVYCWYRNGQGGPVKTKFGSAIHDALFKSSYVAKMKFAIMWENQDRGHAGVSGEADLMANLLPFWIQNYFRHASYLKIDNQPLLLHLPPGVPRP